MNKEEILKRKLEVSRILFVNGVPVDKAKVVGAFIEDLEQENQQLKEQLQQRDKVIEEAINKIEDLRMEKWSIQGTDIMVLLDILNKYKGDNNG